MTVIQFSELLQKEIDATRLHDLLILLGDADAKVGYVKTGWKGTMGNVGLGIMKDNGLRFASLSADNRLVIGSTCCKQKESTSTPGHHRMATTRIRSIMCGVQRRFRRSPLDVRAQQAVDAASNHHLVRCKPDASKAGKKQKETKCQGSCHQF